MAHSLAESGQTSSFMFIGTMVIELREFNDKKKKKKKKKKNMDKMGKLLLLITLTKSSILVHTALF